MFSKSNRKEIARKRHYRLRRRLVGTSDRPRLSVYRSGKHIYAQVIDDLAATTLFSASTVEKEFPSEQSGANVQAARWVGMRLAQRALAGGLTQVVFDRGGFLYHGRIAELADAAREVGLQF